MPYDARQFAAFGGSPAPPYEDPLERVPARIAFIYFKYEYPTVDVTNESNTVEHETIDDRTVIQQLGEKPPQVTVDGVVAQWEAEFCEWLTSIGKVTLRTPRWSGTVIVESVDTTAMNAIDEDDSWLYEVSISCLGVDRTY